MKNVSGFLAALALFLGCGLATAADVDPTEAEASTIPLTADILDEGVSDPPLEAAPVQEAVVEPEAVVEAPPSVEALPAPAEAPARTDIVATALSLGDFQTLAAALEAAGLVDTLKGPGPFTVFAPSDAAFAKQPAGTVDEWLKPENKDKLTGVLTYHVVSGKIPSSDVRTMKAATVNGQELDVVKTDAGITVDGANVTVADIECSNGVIHVVDAVLLPKES